MIVRAAGIGLVLVGCGNGASELARERSPIVHGVDGRIQYYEEPDLLRRERMAASTVAFVANANLDAASATPISAPMLQELEGLCDGEPFGGEPSAAFCTGVLVEPDLVLTAGHCLRLFALDDFSVVSNYHYAAPAELAVRPSDILTPQAIVSQALDGADAAPRLDYAFVRLARPLAPPYAPTPVYRFPPVLAPGDAIVTIGAPFGVPLKLDAGGTVYDARDGSDYFVATTDTAGGWSGGGAFDDKLGLVGIFARGAADLAATDSGCWREVRADSALPSAEEFTYAHVALEALCEVEPGRSLCRADCSEPCAALPMSPKPRASAAAGCSMGLSSNAPFHGAAVAWLFAFALVGRRRWAGNGGLR